MIPVRNHTHPVAPPLAPQPTPVVFVVDGDAAVRETVEQLALPAGWRTQAFDCAGTFLASPRPPSPACVVLDLTLPDIDGLDLQRRIAAEDADMPVVFVTAHGDIGTSVQAMKAGAVDFLTKPLREQALRAAIASAIERSRAARIERAGLAMLQERYESLSPREREVMALVVSGRLNKVVGAELGISEITVKAHRGKLMQKMKARSLAELVRMAVRLGMAPQPRATAREA